MTDIAVTDLTNKTDVDVGTGVFDVLAEAVKLHLAEEHNEGKITGAEYATVYLGALQSILQQSITFILSEQEASKKIDLLDKQIEEMAERIDLVIAQTAQAYEAVAASKAKTSREAILNSRQVLLLNAQTADQLYVTASLRPAELAKVNTETALLEARTAEQLAATIRSDAESTQKIALMAAQTLGFASDTKQKVLRQMNEAWAAAASLVGLANIPEASQDAAIDQLTQEILSDVTTNVDIQSNVQAADLGE